MQSERQGLGSVLVLAAFMLVTVGLPSLIQGLNADAWATWDASLSKPSWQPPGWAFAVVWPLLYVLMAVAAWLVWRNSGWQGARAALAIFWAQLVVNALWTWVYLGLQTLPGAFFWICGLWLLIVVTLLAFRRHSPAAAWLLVPYLAWVTFAAALSFRIWRLNSG